MSDKDRRNRALGEAIRFEMDGRDFFLRAAEQTKNYFGKLMFETIAEDELDHVKRVREIYHRWSDSGKWVSPPRVFEKKDLENIFQEAKEQIPKRVTVGTDEMEAVRLAIQMEMKGRQFYSRLAEEATEEAETGFYRLLAEEESQHLSILQEMEKVLMQSSGLE